MTQEEAAKLIKQYPQHGKAIIDAFIRQVSESDFMKSIQASGTGGMVAPVGMMKAGLNQDGSYGAQPTAAPVQSVPTGPVIDAAKIAAMQAQNERNFNPGAGPSTARPKTWNDRWNDIKAAPQTAWDVLMTDKYKRR